MNRKKLLERGYFPKELPPPFETKLFAKCYLKVLAKAGTYDSISPKESKTAQFSISKGHLSRRRIEIPHPRHFLDLCNYMVNNWAEIGRVLTMSDYSESNPIEGRTNRAVTTKSKSLNIFRFGLLNKSFNKAFELKFDISQFYPTIYTHSITWAIMGRESAKEYFRKKVKNRKGWPKLLVSDPLARLYDTCDRMDTLVRNCQERQSIGIPIGPDTSFILAEMIGSRIDFEISQSIGKEVVGARYFDDYYFYVDTRAEAENVLRICQRIISDYRLQLNDRKVAISERPISLEYEWANILSTFRFKDVSKYELRAFFDIVNKQIRASQTEVGQIVHYAIQRFEYGNVPINQDSWDTFLIHCLNLQIHDSANLDQFLKVLLGYKSFWSARSKKLIKIAMESIIDLHIGLNHSFEVAWALWIMISLKIRCRDTILKKVLDSRDSVSKLVCLDLIHRNLFTGKRPSTSHIYKALTADDLYGEDWLFVYESIIKRWIKGARLSFLDADPFVKLLTSYKVEFYNGFNQLSPEFEFDPDLPPGKQIVRKVKYTKNQELALWHAALGGSKY